MTNHDLFAQKGKKPSRFFYGYIIVLMSFLILLISWGAQYSFGVFLKPVLNEFSWTRAAVSGAYSLNMVLGGIFGIFAGRLSDRFGPRPILTAGGLLIGLGYLLMSQVNAIWQIYVFFGVVLSIGISGMFVPLISTTARWFVKGRGLASGLVMAGVGVGITITPPFANQLISVYNWRTSYIIIGFITLGSIVIFAQFLKRASREGNLLNLSVPKTDFPNVQVRGLSLREALYTGRFWIISLMGLFFIFGVQTVMVHIVAHATDIGISPATAAIILSVVGIVSIGSKIGMGSIGDKIGNRNTMIIIFTLITISFLWIIFSGNLWMLYLFAVVFGLGYGGFASIQSPLVADYFGLKAHGSIFGVIVFASNIGGAVGPLVAGSIFDNSGSYRWAFILCGILGIISLALSILLRPARRPQN